MNRDDPIALLRALDPAAEKDVERVVGALATAGRIETALTRRPRRRLPRHRAWLLAAAVAAAVVLAALAADPFAHDGSISAAQAKAQAARALSLQGDWHIAREIEIAGGTTTEDAWHASDGRLVVTRTCARIRGSRGRRSSPAVSDARTTRAPTR